MPITAAQIGLGQISSAQIGHAQIGLAKVRRVQVNPSQINAAQIDVAEFDACERRELNTSFSQSIPFGYSIVWRLLSDSSAGRQLRVDPYRDTSSLQQTRQLILAPAYQSTEVPAFCSMDSSTRSVVLPHSCRAVAADIFLVLDVIRKAIKALASAMGR